MAMKFGRGGVLVALVAATVVVWWFVRATTKPVGSAERRANATNATTPELPAPVQAGEPARHEEERPEGADAQPPASEDPNEVLARWHLDSEVGIEVEGTVTVVDAHDQEHTEEDGSFTPLAWIGRHGQGGKPVPIEAGRFRMHAPPGCEIDPVRLVLGGREALVTNGRPLAAEHATSESRGGPSRFRVVPSQPIQVKAQWPRPFVLHVVEAGSGSDLRDVAVFGPRNVAFNFDVLHPGSLASAEKLVEHGVSPLELAGPAPGSKFSWQEMAWIHAPGCTWGHVWIDFKKGGEQRVELSPGADLEVAIAGTIPPPPPSQRISYDPDETRAVLRLRDGSGMKMEHEPAIRGSTRIEGLPPGRFDLSLERGTWWDRPLELAKTSVELTAGSTTHATLTIVAKDEARRVPLSGTLHLSDEWNCTSLDLRFEPAQGEGGTSLEKRGLEMKDLEKTDVPGLYRFKLEPVLPGRYVVKCYTVPYQQLVDTGPEGRTDLALVIGDPADVTVHVLDAVTEKTYDEEELLWWNCRFPPGSTGGGIQPAKWDGARSAYEFKAPAGEIELNVNWNAPGRFDPLEPRYLTVKSGANELTIHARRSTGVVLAFELDGRRVPRPSDAKIHLESANGTKLEPFDGSDAFAPIGRDDGLLLRVPSAGTWRLTIDPPAGYEPIPPLDVTLTAGELTTTTVALHRAK